MTFRQISGYPVIVEGRISHHSIRLDEAILMRLLDAEIFIKTVNCIVIDLGQTGLVKILTRPDQKSLNFLIRSGWVPELVGSNLEL